MKTAHIATILGLLASLSCGSDGDSGTGDGESDGAQAGTGPAYLLMHTVSSPEGRQNYVYVVPDLEVGDLDPKAGREVSGASRAFTLDGDVYVADGETLSIKRYTVTEELALVERGELSFQGQGNTYFDTGWTFIDKEHAYYMNGEQLEVVIWNPSTLEITGTIDLSSLDDARFPNFYLDGGTRIGDRIYAMYWNYDESAGTIDGGVNVAVISTASHELLGSTRDERCVAGWPGSAAPNGDFYLPGNAASTGYQFSEPKPAPNCLLRIKAGETEFDPSFVKSMDDLTAPLVGGATFSYAPELDGAVVWALETLDFADRDALFETSVWRPRIVNLETWTSTAVPDRVSAKGWMGDTFIIDGAAHFTVGTNGGTSGELAGAALLRYQDGALEELVRFSEWLQVAQRIR